MPAGSDGTAPGLPRTWRPFGVRMAGVLFGGALVLVSAVAWFAMPDAVREKFGVFQRLTLVLMIGGAFAVWFALVRSRLEARADGLVVVNGYRRRELAWPQVVAVRLPPGAPWATLDLADGTATSVMAIQGSDGRRAQAAVRELRGLIEARASGDGPG